MPDPRQLLCLAVALFIPAYLILTRQKRSLLAWICFTIGVQIFDTRIIANIPAARVAGLLLIPQTVQFLPKILYIRPGKLLVAYFSYILFLGIVFGLIFPWSDGGLLRTFNQLPLGRATIYLIRTAADLSLVFFVTRQVIKQKDPERIIGYFLIGTTVAALSGVIEFLTRMDLYGLFTGLRSLSLEYRMRGFCYEPRALGLIAGQGMLLSILLFSQRPSLKFLGLGGLHALALFLAASTSALLATSMGAACLIFFDRKVRRKMIVLATTGIVIMVALLMLKSQHLTTYLDNIRLRLTINRIEQPPADIIENLAFRMDVLDGPALLFLFKNPMYMLVGTGPGLVTLPATEYLPPSKYFAWLSKTGINTPPSIGWVLELSNTGIIGLTLWGLIYISLFRALNFLSRQKALEGAKWRIGKGAFAAILGVFIMQASPLSPFWSIYLGIGLAAYCLALEAQYPTKETNPHRLSVD